MSVPSINPTALFCPPAPGESSEAATDQEIAETESNLGVKLPADFVSLLKVRNGGALRLTLFRLTPAAAKQYGSEMYSLSRLAGAGASDPERITELTSLARDEWGLPADLVPLDGDGHTWCCLDYRAGGPNGEPAITEVDLDGPCETRVAERFIDLIHGLVRDPVNMEPAVVALDEGSPVGEELAALLKRLGCIRYSLTSTLARSLPSWHWPAYKGLLDDSAAWIQLQQNKENDSPWPLTTNRSPDCPMLTVAVSPVDEMACLGALVSALGKQATLIRGVD